jgi:hypothetical protein
VCTLWKLWKWILKNNMFLMMMSWKRQVPRGTKCYQKEIEKFTSE